MNVENFSLSENALATMKDDVEKLFKKKFTLVDQEDYILPQPDSLFKSDIWHIEELQKLKDELNQVKNYLNDFDLAEWGKYTKSRDIAGTVVHILNKTIQAEFVTQAWCKFYEIVASYPLVPVTHINKINNRFKSIHLCEAPGAFVTSLNHWLKSNTVDVQWNWVATTLNPYYEGNEQSTMINDDRFMKHTLDHWWFGEDYTGNLMNPKNLDMLLEISKPHDEIFLVTADGSISCVDMPDQQESVLGHLHFCETVSAMRLLNIGGSFLLKIFTIFECDTICLMYLLASCFKKIDVIKPASSKSGNSEVYVVCLNFKGLPNLHLEEFMKYYEHGLPKVMFQKDHIPTNFIEKIIQCSEFFKDHQCQVIRRNITSFKMANSDTSLSDPCISEMQNMVAHKYIKDYNLIKIASGQIVGTTDFKKIWFWSSTNSHTSYNERCKNKSLPLRERLIKLCQEVDKKELCKASKIVILTNNTLPESLWISPGKEIDKIRSSVFCDSEMLKLKNEIDAIVQELRYNVNNFEENAMSSHETNIMINFKGADTYEIIELLCDKLQSMENGDILMLYGLSLLTHINVGLLYLIGHSFQCVKFKQCPIFGQSVILHRYLYNVKVTTHLLHLKITSSYVDEQDKCIVGIFPPYVLHGHTFFYAILRSNCCMIKAHAQNIMTALNRDEEI